MTDFMGIEFTDNPDPRCPTVLVLDCSDSMTQKLAGEDRSPLEAMNGALDTLVSEVFRDNLSRRRVEFSFVPYGREVGTPTPFSTVSDIILPELEPMGTTSTGAALEVALDHLEARKAEYKANGVSYYQPIMMLISDGLSMDDLGPATQRIKDAQNSKKLSFFAIGVEGADTEQLSSIGVRPALGLKGVRFDELFQWLSASVASVSASNPGDVVALPSGLDAWAEL